MLCPAAAKTPDTTRMMVAKSGMPHGLPARRRAAARWKNRRIRGSRRSNKTQKKPKKKNASETRKRIIAVGAPGSFRRRSRDTWHRSGCRNKIEEERNREGHEADEQHRRAGLLDGRLRLGAEHARVKIGKTAEHHKEYGERSPPSRRSDAGGGRSGGGVPRAHGYAACATAGAGSVAPAHPGPFQRGRAGAPRIGWRHPPPHQSADERDEEHEMSRRVRSRRR